MYLKRIFEENLRRIKMQAETLLLFVRTKLLCLYDTYNRLMLRSYQQYMDCSSAVLTALSLLPGALLSSLPSPVPS